MLLGVVPSCAAQPPMQGWGNAPHNNQLQSGKGP